MTAAAEPLAGALDVEPSLLQARSRIGVIEAREHFVARHTLTLLDQHLEHFAGDLGGNGGLAARNDVSRCIQK